VANDRGERIALVQRNRKRWERHVATWRSNDGEWRTRFVQRASQHGKLCSCMGCGNARSHEGPTLQERRIAEAWPL
jgi:hypothetical protein